MQQDPKSEIRNPGASRRPLKLGNRGFRISVFGICSALLLLELFHASSQVIGPVKGFKLAEAYEPPHQMQLKFLLQGAQAEALDRDRTEITTAKLWTYRVNGDTNLVITAPQALHDRPTETVSSPGPLRVQTADAKFSIEGDGFLWRQTNASLLVSNHVHTIIQPALLDTGSNQVSHDAKSTNGPVHIYADRFAYDNDTGVAVYVGAVQAVGTNRELSLRSGLLRVKIPAQERQLQTITAETNVVIDYAGLHATGARADYSVSNGIARIRGQPTWRATPREGRGDELVIDQTNKVFKALGHAWMKMPGVSLGTTSFVLGTNSAGANTSKSTNQVVEVWSDNYEFRTNWGVFRDKVRVREHRDAQDLRLMSCRTLTVFLAGTNELESLVAEGDVRIEEETNRLSGARAVFTATNGVLDLTGNPEWHAGVRSGKGDRVRISREQMLVTGNAVMRLPAEELADSTTRTNQPRHRAAAPQFAEIYSQDYTLRTNRAVFRGGVYASHPSLNLACERLDVELGTNASRVVTAEQGVVFDLKDEHGQLHGAGDKAVYTVLPSGNATNELLRLTGNPALMKMTNGLATSSVFLLNRLTGDLTAPGGDYHLQGTGPAFDTNRLVLPKPKFSK